MVALMEASCLLRRMFMVCEKVSRAIRAWVVRETVSNAGMLEELAMSTKSLIPAVTRVGNASFCCWR